MNEITSPMIAKASIDGITGLVYESGTSNKSIGLLWLATRGGISIIFLICAISMLKVFSLWGAYLIYGAVDIFLCNAFLAVQ